MKLASAVVLYHPDADVFENIESYLPSLGKLYILDNSEEADESVALRCRKFSRAEYIPYGENRGISYALNDALRRAEADGFDWLLTMDQDSRFEPGDFKKYLREAEKLLTKEERVAEIGVHNSSDRKEGTITYEEIWRVITSGSLVDIRAARETGGFDEEMFIDQVDFEFCYRLREYGYRVFRVNAVTLKHHLGNPIQKKFPGKTLLTFNHGPVRKYYIARNGVYVAKKYPRYRGGYVKTLPKIFLKIFLMEPDKLRRARYFLRGIRDGLLGRMGKMKD